jgi:hypothetical protein
MQRMVSEPALGLWPERRQQAWRMAVGRMQRNRLQFQGGVWNTSWRSRWYPSNGSVNTLGECWREAQAIRNACPSDTAEEEERLLFSGYLARQENSLGLGLVSLYCDCPTTLSAGRQSQSCQPFGSPAHPHAHICTNTY